MDKVTLTHAKPIWTQFGLWFLLSLRHSVLASSMNRACLWGSAGVTRHHVRYYMMVSVTIFEVLLRPPPIPCFPDGSLMRLEG